MSDPQSIFTHQIDFDPAGDFEAFLKSVPARWVVYLMSDGDGQPIQLLCVRNLRASLKRRLGGEETVGPTRKINYRELVRRISWRAVDSVFEADWQYYEHARQLFPDTYGGMSGFRKTWWIHVDPQATHPRYTKTNDPTAGIGRYFGPIEDKHGAGKLVEHIEALFDLCRDYRLLTQAPHGGPCAWKQMGKCVGPCDGTISLEVYRQLIAYSADVLADPHGAIERETQRMHAAAAALAFESAGAIKQYIDQLSRLTKASARRMRPLEQFKYLSVQPGPQPGKAKLFLILPGRIEEVAGLIDAPGLVSDILRQVLARAAEPMGRLDHAAAERMSIVANHLFSPRHGGVFLPLDELTDRTLAKAWRDLQKQKLAPESDDEGITRELQSL